MQNVISIDPIDRERFRRELTANIKLSFDTGKKLEFTIDVSNLILDLIKTQYTNYMSNEYRLREGNEYRNIVLFKDNLLVDTEGRFNDSSFLSGYIKKAYEYISIMFTDEEIVLSAIVKYGIRDHDLSVREKKIIEGAALIELWRNNISTSISDNPSVLEPLFHNLFTPENGFTKLSNFDVINQVTKIKNIIRINDSFVNDKAVLNLLNTHLSNKNISDKIADAPKTRMERIIEWFSNLKEMRRR